MHPTREEAHVPSSPRLRRSLALLLAGGALAVGVPAALAATGGSDTSSAASGAPATQRFTQDDSTAPRGHDCPDRDRDGDDDGDGGGGSGGGGGQGGATAPSTGDSTPSL